MDNLDSAADIPKVVQPVSHARYLYAVLLAFGSCLFMVIAITTTVMVTGVNPLMVVMLRSALGFCVSLSIFVFNYDSPNTFAKQELRYVIPYTIAGTLLTVSIFLSVKYIPVGDSIAIRLTFPLIVNIVSYFWLKEPFGWFQAFATAMGIIGVVFISRPTFLFGGVLNDHSNVIIGSVVSIFGCCFKASHVLLNRKIQITSSNTLLMFSCGTTIPVVAIYLSCSQELVYPTCGWDIWVLTFAGGAFLNAAVRMVMHSGKIISANHASMIATSTVVFGYVGQITVLGVIPLATSLIGAALIMTTLILTGIKNMKKVCKPKLQAININYETTM